MHFSMCSTIGTGGSYVMPTAGATPWPIWSRSSVRLRQLDQMVERCTHRAQPDSRAVALKDMLLDKGLDAGTGLPGAMFPRRADIDQDRRSTRPTSSP